ncbi:MAG: hypothetical protein ACK5U1_12520, partial [Cyclobacteriaceae bacterium]
PIVNGRRQNRSSVTNPVIDNSRGQQISYTRGGRETSGGRTRTESNQYYDRSWRSTNNATNTNTNSTRSYWSNSDGSNSRSYWSNSSGRSSYDGGSNSRGYNSGGSRGGGFSGGSSGSGGGSSGSSGGRRGRN